MCTIAEYTETQASYEFILQDVEQDLFTKIIWQLFISLYVLLWAVIGKNIIFNIS